MMGRRGSGCRYTHALFNLGPVGGLTDGELLARFTAGGAAAELAFAALVARHGPMVLRVCGSILRDEHDAQDALQATFLVLVRRAASVRNRDSVASWLHGVALRVARSDRVSVARRRMHETRAAELATEDVHDESQDPYLAPVLHEELDRLPERFRAVVVLCHLEGLACEAAATHLGLPVGTVKSRLARGRDRLRTRLIRRGLAPSAAVVGSLLGGEHASAALSPTIVDSTARIATGVLAGEASSLGAIPSSVAAITRRILAIMTAGRFLRWAGLVLALAASMAVVSVAQRAPADPARAKAQRSSPGTATPPAEDPKRVRPEAVLEEALKAADQVPVAWMKAQALADLAATQARLGQADPSKATFQRATEIIGGINDDAIHRAANLSKLAQAAATAGDRERTRATIARMLESATKIDRGDGRRSLLLNAVMGLAKAGDAGSALAVYGGLQDAPASTRAFALAEIAGGQSRVGDLAGARATMARADAEADRAEEAPIDEKAALRGSLDFLRLARVRAMAPLAAAEVKTGELDAARATLRRARAIAVQIGEEWRPAALAEIAMAQRKTGDRDAAEATLAMALKTAEGLKDPERAVQALAQVAVVQGDWDDRGSARATLKKATDLGAIVPATGDSVPQFMAAACARAHDWEAGRQSALNLRDEVLRSNCAEFLSFEQAKAGEARAALDWAETLTDPLIRARALLGVVRGIIEPKA
jgi:RNA polymerase sigma factor (sigma-70 family)